MTMADKLVSVNDDFDFPAPVAARQAARLGDATTAEGKALLAGFEATVYRTGVELSITNANKYILGETVDTTWVTPDGSGVVVHPSVRFFPNGFNGYQWWAAATPYLGSDNQVENPCIFVSTDGTNWTPPPGVTNPLAGPPPAGYNSDTHLIQHPDGRLLLFYRDYSSTGSAPEKIVLMESRDGIEWSKPREITASQDNVRRLMSPAVWFDGGSNKWVMLAVEILAQPRKVQRFTAPDAYGPWTYDRDVTFDLPWGTGRSPWHIDAMLIGQQVLLVVQDATFNSGGGDVYLALSSDKGRTFKRATLPVATGNRYRSCVLPKLTEQGLALDLWLGTVGGSWGVKRGTAIAPVQGQIPTETTAMLTLLAAKTGTAPYLVGDDFSRPNSTTGLGVAPSGQAWVASQGTLAIVGRRATVPVAGNSRAFLDIGTANYELSLDIYAVQAGGNQAWLVFRAVDGANYLRVGRDGFALTLQRVTNGSVTVLHTFPATPASATGVAVRAAGDKVTVTAGGSTQTVTEAQGQASTLAGIQISSPEVSVKNFIGKLL